MRVDPAVVPVAFSQAAVGELEYTHGVQAALEGHLARGSPDHAARVHKIGRNDLCPCGSGKKYKDCHEGAGSVYLERLARKEDKPGAQLVVLASPPSESSDHDTCHENPADQGQIEARYRGKSHRRR